MRMIPVYSAFGPPHVTEYTENTPRKGTLVTSEDSLPCGQSHCLWTPCCSVCVQVCNEMRCHIKNGRKPSPSSKKKYKFKKLMNFSSEKAFYSDCRSRPASVMVVLLKLEVKLKWLILLFWL